MAAFNEGTPSRRWLGLGRRGRDSRYCREKAAQRGGYEEEFEF